MISSKVDSIISICKSEHSPLWSSTLPDNGSMRNFIKSKYLNIRSQDLAQYYRLNGAIYISKTNCVIKNKSLMSGNSFPYIMNLEDSVDIDTNYDFIFAEALLKNRIENN